MQIEAKVEHENTAGTMPLDHNPVAVEAANTLVDQLGPLSDGAKVTITVTCTAGEPRVGKGPCPQRCATQVGAGAVPSDNGTGKVPAEV
jgi:hypothetical protein